MIYIAHAAGDAKKIFLAGAVDDHVVYRFFDLLLQGFVLVAIWGRKRQRNVAAAVRYWSTDVSRKTLSRTAMACGCLASSKVRSSV